MTSQPASVPPNPEPNHPQAAPTARPPSNSPSRSPGRSAPTRRGRNAKVLLAAGVLVVLVVGVVAVGVARAFRPHRDDLVTHTVQFDRLELTVVERGAMESADNRDIYCRVKSGAKNSTISTTIKSVVDDGSFVKKGQLIVELDDSGLIEQLKGQKIVMDTAESAKIQAEEAYKITRLQNESDLNNALTVRQLAEIDLEKYVKGDYEQALKDVLGKIKVAEGDVQQQLDRAAWSQRMVKKGYQTVSQAQAEQSKLESLEITLASAVEAKRVLTDENFGMKKRTVTDLGNKVNLAKNAVDTIRLQNAAKDVQFKTDQENKRSLFRQQQQAYKDIEEEIKKCKIYAPQDGMVVYYIPEQTRGGAGAQQSIIAQGEPVREGQKLMQIPDLKHMVVNTKVHEALVSRVHRGQPATVRIDAYPDRTYPSHVASVATISSQQDWLSADVKVYTTKVAIDEEVDGLKPGMSAEVTITIGDALEHVLTVPVQAIAGSVELGSKRLVYVMTPDGPEPREVVVGLSNDRMAEIRKGLAEGDEVVLNPKVIAGDAMKFRKEGDKKSKEGPPTTDADKKPAGKPREGQMTPEQQQRRKEMTDRFKKASPDERKRMLEQVPEEARDKVKQRLKAEGIEINE
jgi:multidrug resistance efflux pump